MNLAQLRPWLIAALVFVLAFDAAFLWQRTLRAERSEFGAHPDEAAHYVTGLMIRDYIAAGFPGSPMKFADDYYAHYPKIGLGVWPPFFYLVQSAWMLPFGVSRTSILLLLCALAAAVATLIYLALRREFGHTAAALGGLLFLSLPLAREYYSMVMAETLTAGLMLAAALAFGNFLDREKKSDAIAFGILAALAILTKGTGVALVLLVPLAICFSRKWHLLATPILWASAALTAILAGPWTWYFRNEGRLKGGWLQPNPSFSFTREAAPFYANKLVISLGVVVTILACIGFLCPLLCRQKNQLPTTVPCKRLGQWHAAAALIASVFLFQIIMPVGLEARHLISALPPAVMFAVAGAATLTRRFVPEHLGSPVSTAHILGVMLLPLVIAISITTHFFRIYPKLWSGFAPIAEVVVSESKAPHSTILVSSDASGEGMFISELAMREKRPGHIVARASKLLASMSWSGADYRARFSTDVELAAFLTKSDIATIVLDDSMPPAKRGAHADMLDRVCEENPAQFHLIADSPVVRGGRTDFPPIRAFRIVRGN